MAYPSALDLSLANVALGRISEVAIGAFNENSVAARAVARIYPQCRNLMMAAADWRFNTARLIYPAPPVPPVLPTPFAPWTYENALPGDVARVRTVLSTLPEDPYTAATGSPDPWEEGMSALIVPGTFTRVIRTNIAPFVLVYGLVVEDPALWDQAFTAAFTVQLAAELAMPVIGNGAIAQALRQEAAQAVAAMGPMGQVQSVTAQPRGPSRTMSARGGG